MKKIQGEDTAEPVRHGLAKEGTLGAEVHETSPATNNTAQNRALQKDTRARAKAPGGYELVVF